MAKMIDKEPKYEGEKKVWHAFYKNLPSDWVVYNTRSINGKEYDFCVISPNMGLFIVEVKGWNPDGILNVIDSNTIFLAGEEDAEDSPRGQARGYRFDLHKKIQRELGMSPLVMSFVCYPCISEVEYFAKGLNVVSESNETIFNEDLSEALKLYQKFNERYTIDKGAKHDELDAKSLALIRHHFEPNYDLKEEQQLLNPGYSRLRIFKDDFYDENAVEIAEEYFSGIKEIVFVSSRDAMLRIVKELETRFIERKIRPDKKDLVIDKWSAEKTTIEDGYSIFNCEIEVVSDLSTYVEDDLLIEEGVLSEKEEEILRKLSDKTDFNYQQYEIEHAPTDRNILIMAGAGTGKTYSMVSRVAYLCNKTADAVVDITGEIAMITFTKDAADNMKIRLKKMFMNYFILTSNEKYMHLIEEMNQIQISTIHKFAISLLQKDCMRMGLGYDSQITSETYNRQQLYHQYLNEYLLEKDEENPDFVRQLTMPIYKLEELLISFCGKLYDRSVDIRALMYLVQIYHDYFEEQDADLYGSKKVHVPEPELYMIFTGERASRPEIISLSKEFFGGKECAVEVKVKVLCGGKGNDIISQYVAFTKVYNEQVKKYKRSQKAVTETIRICKDRDVLREFLAGREKEVISIMMALFDEEKIMRTHIASEKKAASKETARKAAEKMLRDRKITVDEITEYFSELSAEDIQEIEKGLLQTV